MKNYDELFKKQFKDFFQKFATVITEYEIVKLPKKVDILIVELQETLNAKLDIFSYFNKYNIIEFKSPGDKFVVGEDDLKISFYINGVLLQEKEANENNTTFTVVSSAKPERFLSKYKGKCRIVRKGIYRIDDIALIPVYVVVIKEIDGDFTEEYALLKEFSSGQDLKNFIKQFLEKCGTINDSDILEVLLSLYGLEVIKIMKELNMHGNLIEKNINDLVEELGLKEKYKQEGKIEGKDEGKFEGARLLLIRQLRRKFGLSEAEVALVMKCNDEEIIEVASYKFADGYSKEEVLSVFLG